MPSNSPKLPPNAKMAFKGVIFEVWQWEQEMFDGSQETFEVLKRPNTAIVIAAVGDKILLQKQSQPYKSEPFFSIPGGRCEEDEKALTSAKRELLEETGYQSDDWNLWKEINPVGKMIWTIFVFVARNCTPEKAPCLDAGEKITTTLISFDEFLALGDDPTFYEREIKGYLTRARFDPKFREEFHKIIFG